MTDIFVKIPKKVRKPAKEALYMKKLGFTGGTPTGWKRAKQLAFDKYIPLEDLRVMRAWFARHIYTSYPGYKRWVKEGKPLEGRKDEFRGAISWNLWGGDEALKWIKSKKISSLLDKHYSS